jgi:8-oxo-dGTP diphosphatase
MQIITAARACLVYENKLLLVSGDGSYWHLPGGHLELEEDLKQCAKRETFEETGLDAIIGDIIYVSEFYDKNWDTHKIDCIFSACLNGTPNNNKWEDLGHDKSITMRQWFSLDEIKNMNNVFPDYLKDGKWLNPAENKVYMGYDR